MNGKILIQNGSGISRATPYGVHVFNTAMIFYIGATLTTIVITYVIYRPTIYFLSTK